MKRPLPGGAAIVAAALASGLAPAGPQEPEGAPAVAVTHADGRWVIAGARTRVLLDPKDLALRIEAGPASWATAPSAPGDLRVRRRGEDVALRLADARRVSVQPYRTGFKTGVKVALEGWRPPRGEAGADLDVSLFLTLALEGADEELVFEAAAREGDAQVRQLDWPGATDAEAVDHTVLSNYRGNLVPRRWPREFHPVRPSREDGTIPPTDVSEVQSHNIECWSMSWWGFQKGRSALMVLIETPDDAAYQFRHPAGGPTVIGPRWLASLGRFGAPRRGRLIFLPSGNYVQMAKRYRRHVMETGQFVSLREKIARNPAVQRLIGTPLARVGILTNIKPDSARYRRNTAEQNHRLTTFDERARQLRALKAAGVDRLHVCLTGWPRLGYDRQHPDVLPPAPEAGGWEAMKRLAETCAELGYLLTLHEQYRDYYVDAPSYDAQFAVHEEDEGGAPHAFPGTRFGHSKEGRIPFMDHWDGGKMTYLSPGFMLGHLRKNHEWLLARGIRPLGAYLDVFGYIPPDEDFNPEHPVTRSACLRERAACYQWTRHRLGIVGSEAAADWVIPYVDFSSPLRPGRCVGVPLFELVYHDAIITPYAAGDLHGLLDGGLPQGFNIAEAAGDRDAQTRRRMAALHERVALLEMTSHEFLDQNYRKERTTFADGTTVTVDWDAATAVVTP